MPSITVAFFIVPAPVLDKGLLQYPVGRSGPTQSRRVGYLTGGSLLRRVALSVLLILSCIMSPQAGRTDAGLLRKWRPAYVLKGDIWTDNPELKWGICVVS